MTIAMNTSISRYFKIRIFLMGLKGVKFLHEPYNGHAYKFLQSVTIGISG
jgi:hypothetical protein